MVRGCGSRKRRGVENPDKDQVGDDPPTSTVRPLDSRSPYRKVEKQRQKGLRIGVLCRSSPDTQGTRYGNVYRGDGGP